MSSPQFAVVVPLAIALVIGVVAGWSARALDGGGGDRHKGWASRTDVRSGLGKRAARRSAAYTRPKLGKTRRAPLEECGVLLGNKAGRLGASIYSALEDCVLIVGPPRQGKTIQLKGNLIQFPGAAVATSTKLDVVRGTAKRRKRSRGPVYLLGPGRNTRETAK